MGPRSDDEADEVDGVRHPDDRWLADLFAARYRELVGLAALVVGDRALAEDVVQDAFAGLHRRAEPLADPDAALGYLRRSTVNGARSRLRRRAVERRPHVRVVATTDRSPEDEAVAGDDARAVAAAVAQLPLRQRECLAATYQLGLTNVAVAELLGISAGSVKTHLHRAGRRLAELLEDRR